MTATSAHTLIIIPCSAPKLDGTHAARDLYVGANFASFLRNAEAHAAGAVDTFGTPVTAAVMILSARYGLVALDVMIASYDVTMGDDDAITAAGVAAQLAELAPTTIEALLPAAYRRTLAAAVELSNDDDANEWIEFHDVYEAAPGIGFQRGVAGQLGRAA